MAQKIQTSISQPMCWAGQRKTNYTNCRRRHVPKFILFPMFARLLRQRLCKSIIQTKPHESDSAETAYGLNPLGVNFFYWKYVVIFYRVNSYWYLLRICHILWRLAKAVREITGRSLDSQLGCDSAEKTPDRETAWRTCDIWLFFCKFDPR